MSWTSGVDFPDEKYFEVYTTTNLATACSENICDGEALIETAGWYNDSILFLAESRPWFFRSGYWYNNKNGGIFYFDSTTGQEYGNGSSRIILISN